MIKLRVVINTNAPKDLQIICKKRYGFHYEIIEDEGTYWGEVPGLQGVWARRETLEGCRRELRDALSDWVALRLPIPEIAGIDLNTISHSA